MPFFTSSDKALWHLALPMIFSNITVPLLGLVDTAVIGHLDSPVYLGGVAVGATATSFLFMLLLFLRMSTTGLTAQAFGAKNPQALARALVQPQAESVTLLLFLSYLEGRTGQRLFSSDWISLVGGLPDELEALASSASHRSLMVFMNAGGVKEVRFPGYLTPEEEHIRLEVSHVI